VNDTGIGLLAKQYW